MSANPVAAWADRYFEQPEMMTEAEVEAVPVVRETHGGKLQQEILTGPHRMLADGQLSFAARPGAGPYDYLLSKLGACTSMTIRLYADFEKLPLENVSVRLSHGNIHSKGCGTCDTKVDLVDRLDRAVALEGPLDPEQRKRLMEIADRGRGAGR